MVFFNLIGFVELVAALVVAAVLQNVFGTTEYEPYGIARVNWFAVALVPVDLAFRFVRVRPRLVPPGNWLTDGAGGSLMLLPAWITGLGAAVLLYVYG